MPGENETQHNQGSHNPRNVATQYEAERCFWAEKQKNFSPKTAHRGGCRGTAGTSQATWGSRRWGGLRHKHRHGELGLGSPRPLRLPAQTTNNSEGRMEKQNGHVPGSRRREGGCRSMGKLGSREQTQTDSIGQACGSGLGLHLPSGPWAGVMLGTKAPSANLKCAAAGVLAQALKPGWNLAVRGAGLGGHLASQGHLHTLPDPFPRHPTWSAPALKNTGL